MEIKVSRNQEIYISPAEQKTNNFAGQMEKLNKIDQD